MINLNIFILISVLILKLNNVKWFAGVIHRESVLQTNRTKTLIQQIVGLVIVIEQRFRSCWLLRTKVKVVHTKHDVISILIDKYTYKNMNIIKKIISCIFIYADI